MATLPPNALSPLLLSAAIAFAYVRRIRRHFGRQPYRARRALVRLVLLAVAAAGLLLMAVLLPATGVALAIAGGLAAGTLLGTLAVAQTRIEREGDARWYTPNPWIGGALSVLLLARLAWRFGHGAFAAGTAQAAQNASPLTLGLAALLVAFYLANGAGLAWRMRALARPSTAA